jgi:phytoene dehydrogenase-like protein
MQEKSVIIIGAGFAGLCAGIYARLNGYQAHIFELHDKPGGLCTSWKRKGYTIDGCIHWLVGSSPKSGMHQFWEEVGLTQGREFLNADEYSRYEGADGRTVIFYCNVERLETHLLEMFPLEEKPIRELTSGIRMGIRMSSLMDSSDAKTSILKKIGKGLSAGWFFLLNGRKLQYWMKTTTLEYLPKIKDPLLRDALNELWMPDFPLFFMLFTFSYLNNQNAGYPIGGSRPMSEALEKRFLDLGGEITYKVRVAKILVENGRAVGIRLVDGSEHHAGRVISAADGHTTIYKMLDGKYKDESIDKMYREWKPFPPLVFVGIGVDRDFQDTPRTVSGISIPLNHPLDIGDKTVDRLPIHIFNQDPTMAPKGKTSMVVMLPSNYEYWKELSADRASYDEKKDQVARGVVTALEERFPGIGSQVEMVDVATPLTFERYTGNWQGSFEGWMITAENAGTVTRPLSQKLPGLESFYLCGQWVEPGGGLPTGVMSARRLFHTICKEDGSEFHAETAPG